MGNKLAVHVVDTDSRSRAALAMQLADLGYHAEIYEDASEFAARAPRPGIAIAQWDAPMLGGRAFLRYLRDAGRADPVVMVATDPPVAEIVAAMRAGACDFLQKPVEAGALSMALQCAWQLLSRHRRTTSRMAAARHKLDRLSPREREVLDELAQGKSNKQIASAMAISPRTVELHRAHLMEKLDARHVSDALHIQFDARELAKIGRMAASSAPPERVGM